MVAPGPSFSVADVQRGWTRALEGLGHEVRTYNLDDRLSFFGAATIDGEHLDGGTAVRMAIEPLGSACYKWWPDVIFVVSGFFISDELWKVWRARSHKIVLLNTESPYEDDRQYDRMLVGEPDVMLINDPTNINVFREHTKNTWYAPHAYDPMVHTPFPRDEKYDFSFVGTGYPSRIDFFARVDWRDLEVGFAGHWKGVEGTALEDFVIHDTAECYDNDDAVDLYRATKVGANLYRARSGTAEATDPRLAQGWAIGPREVELAATRTFFLREPRPEGDELFPFLPTFTEPAEFGELLRYYLSHDNKRQDAARRAREAIVDRTFDAHARLLMQHLPD